MFAVLRKSSPKLRTIIGNCVTKMNWNIRLAYVQTVGFAIGMGIIQIAFSVYVTLGLGQPNLILGYLFTVQGLASTIFVFPSGYFADKYRRDLLIRISVIFGVLAQLLLILATTSTSDVALNILYISQFMAGLGWGLSGPASMALIADSIEPGNRSRVFAKMHFVNLVASALGPCIAVGLILILGDTWEIEVLRAIIFVGAISGLFAYVAIIFVSDSKAIVTRIERIPPPLTPESSSTEESLKEPPVLTIFGRPFTYDVIVPSVIVISGIIIGFGAGATVAYFPVLFANPDIGYGLKPLFTYSVFGITNVVTGLMGLLAQRMIRIIGRIGSMFLVQGLAIVCLLGLVVNLALYQNQIISFPISVILLALFYISRNALMNASGPVSRSIVMDVVPSASRAKWNSLETLAWGMFWSVSASIGGFIVDSYGFLIVFIFTATLYTIATLMILIIRNRVPKESILSHTYHLGKLQTRNRVVMPSTLIGETKAGDIVTGQLTYGAISYYSDTAKGGAGLVYLEPAYISLSGKGHPHQIGIHDDYVIPRLREVVNKVHENKALIGIRLTHAGGATKKSICGTQPLAPSSVPSLGGDTPRPLALGEIDELHNTFVDAAVRAAEAGFDVVEISSCLSTHSSDLLGQFISSEYNKRTDEYGGLLTNRIRFPLEVAQAIRAHLPPRVMFAYYLSFPFQGISDDELSTVVKSIEMAGIELLCIDYSPSLAKKYEADFEHFIQEIKTALPSLPLVLSGDFDVESAETVLKLGQADFIGFGRFLQENLTFPQALN